MHKAVSETMICDWTEDRDVDKRQGERREYAWMNSSFRRPKYVWHVGHLGGKQ